MRAALDLDDEQISRGYQHSRLFQAVDNLRAAHETSRANAITTLVYDALGAAVDVHLNASGLKITGKDQHRLAVEYAASTLPGIVDDDDLTIYDELRLVRHRVIEYPPIGSFRPPNSAEADRYLTSADRFIGAIDAWWRTTAPNRP